MENALTVQWNGPFSFVPRDDQPCVFEQPLGQHPGIYLWTVKQPDGYLVNYVGETSRQTLHARLAQEVQDVLGGRDCTWTDLDLFETGVRRVAERIPIQQFLAEYEGRSRHVIRLLKLYHVFIAPHTGSLCTTKELESLIIRMLRQGGERITSFLANKRVGAPRPLGTKVEFQAPCNLIGIGCNGADTTEHLA